MEDSIKTEVNSKNVQKNDKNRIEYIDVARAIAIVSITCNHAVNRTFNVASDSFTEFNTIPFYLTLIKAIIYTFSRIGVPIFLMISGVLLLPRDYTGDGKLKRFINHNWLSLLVTTEIWLFIMYWYKQLSPDSALFSKGIGLSILNSVATLFYINPDTMGSMWYMEMILCVYLLIPILSISLKNIPKKYFVLPCTIVIIHSYIIPIVNGILTGLGSSIKVDFLLSSNNVFSMYIIFLLCGYFISQGLFNKINTKVVVFIMIASFLLFVALQTWVWSTAYDYVFATSYKDVFILMIAACIFEMLQRVKINNAVKIISRKLAPISFGIYFVHICIMEGLNKVMNQYCPNFVYLEKFLILETISFLGSVIIILLLKKNKYIAKYLFGIKN